RAGPSRRHALYRPDQGFAAARFRSRVRALSRAPARGLKRIRPPARTAKGDLRGTDRRAERVPSWTATAGFPAIAAVAAPPAAAGTRRRRASFVHRHRTAAVNGAVQLVDRCLGFRVAGHLDEPEPLAAAGLAIGDQLRGLDAAERRELFDEIVFGGGERQVAD